MTTIVNTPPRENNDSGNMMSLLVGAVILFAFAFVFFVYGLPMIRSSFGSGVSAPQVNVPEKIDVNINQSE